MSGLSYEIGLIWAGIGVVLHLTITICVFVVYQAQGAFDWCVRTGFLAIAAACVLAGLGQIYPAAACCGVLFSAGVCVAYTRRK